MLLSKWNLARKTSLPGKADNNKGVKIMSNEKQSYETSALKNILNAGAIGAASPSKAAQIAASASRHTPPGAESTVAQVLQAGVNMAVVGSKEFMEGTIRQHGRSPSAVLQDLKIQQAIDNKTPSTPTNQPTANKGIEAARQKAEEKQSEASSSQSTNKGIESYRNQASGQSTANSNSSSNSQGQSNGSGQDR
jgi:hypothetical protein